MLKNIYKKYLGYTYYTGHYGYEVYKKVAKGHALVTNFKSPVSRILSLYNYWRNDVAPAHTEGMHQKDIDVVKTSKDNSFSDFIRLDDPYLKTFLHDSHYRQLLNSNWRLDFGGMLSNWTVRQRIEGLHWFYIAEFPELSMHWFRKRFPELAEKNVKRLNQSTYTKREISDDDIKHIMRMNRRDFRIYAHALRKLIRETS